MFIDRWHAGKELALKFKEEFPDVDKKDLVVFGIPRGGVVVAKSFAKEIGIKKVYALVVRKIRHPFYKEVALGALCKDKIVWNDFAKEIKDKEEVKEEIALQKKVIEEREKKYGEDVDVEGKNVIIIDDGLATGATMLAAIKCVKKDKPKKIIAAAPVASQDAYNLIFKEAIPLVIKIPLDFYAVGQYYQDFKEVSDEVVMALLDKD